MDQKKKQLLLGATLAAVAVLMTQLYIDSEVERWKPKDFVDLTVASKPIPSGTVLNPSLTKKVTVPKQFAPITAIPAAQIEQFFGQNLAQDIVPGDYILEGSFAARRSVSEYLSEQIQGDGARAITVPVSETSSLASSIRAGDLVDVVYSFEIPDSNSQMTSLLLQNVLVVSTGGYSAENAEAGESDHGYNTLTLQLNVSDALKLKYAEKNGTIDFLLRRRSDGSPVQLSSISNVKDILNADDSRKLAQLAELKKDGPDPEALRESLASQMRSYEGLGKGLGR